MQNVTIEDYCDCPIECNFLSYSYSFVSKPLEPKKVCPKGKYAKDEYLMYEFYKNKSPPQFVRRLKQLKENITSDEFEYCKRDIAYRAEVTFFLATESVSVTVMTRRLSFFDQLSAFGNYIC